MLGFAKRNIETVYKEKGIIPENIIIARHDIERILLFMSKEDEVERIYINFCNPWPRGKHNKRRLTHPRQLEQYKSFMNEGASIYFKTDDDALFEDSISYFKNSNFEIIKLTYNLASEDIFEGNIKTEHEMMFESQGIKIKALIAKVNK